MWLMQKRSKQRLGKILTFLYVIIESVFVYLLAYLWFGLAMVFGKDQRCEK